MVAATDVFRLAEIVGQGVTSTEVRRWLQELGVETATPIPLVTDPGIHDYPVFRWALDQLRKPLAVSVIATDPGSVRVVDGVWLEQPNHQRHRVDVAFLGERRAAAPTLAAADTVFAFLSLAAEAGPLTLRQLLLYDLCRFSKHQVSLGRRGTELADELISLGVTASEARLLTFTLDCELGWSPQWGTSKVTQDASSPHPKRPPVNSMQPRRGTNGPAPMPPSPPPPSAPQWPPPLTPPASSPPPRRQPSRRRLTATFAIVVAVVLAVLAGILLAPHTDGPIAVAGNNESHQPTEQPTSPPTKIASGNPTSSPTLSTNINTEQRAQKWLTDRVTSDRPSIEAVLDEWVPVVSYKTVGTKDSDDALFPGKPYNKDMIVRNFQYWSEQYSDAVLAKSSEYKSFRNGFYITLIPQPQADADAVLAWCDSEGLSVKNCYATRASHTRQKGDDTAKFRK